MEGKGPGFLQQGQMTFNGKQEKTSVKQPMFCHALVHGLVTSKATSFSIPGSFQVETAKPETAKDKKKDNKKVFQPTFFFAKCSNFLCYKKMLEVPFPASVLLAS